MSTPTQPPPPASDDNDPGPGGETLGERHRRRVRTRRGQVPRSVRTNYLLHIFFYDARFRWAMIATALIFLALGLLLPKIWITSPKDFLPVIKVSGLDLLQSRSLQQAATRAEAAGRSKEALPSWVAAVAADAANPAAVRGLLRALVRQPLPDRAWLPVGQQQAGSLLRLTQTNVSDLELTVQFHARYDQHEWIISRLSESNAPATPNLNSALLRSLFLAGQMQQFGVAWAQRGTSLAGLPEPNLYHASWQAGWGPAAESNTGRDRLEAALGDPAHRRLALFLLLRLHYKTLDLGGYERRLAELTDLHADTVKDHVAHWMLLELSGRRADAVALARLQSAPPQTADEAEQLLTAWTRLGLYDEGVEFVNKQLPGFAMNPGLWVRAGQLLIAGKRWDDLRAAGINLRGLNRLRPVMGNYGRFLEGVAAHGLGRRLDAETSFGEYIELPPPDASLTFQSAVTLSRLGYANTAAVLLRQLEARAGNNLDFWKQVQLTAFEAQQAELLLAASEKVFQLQPDDANANNFAAALLMMRERSPEAVQLTLRVFDHAPQSRLARINHALALVQNGRVSEGEELLKTVAPEELNETARSILHFVWFQCHLVAGRTTAARTAAGLIDLRFLFPPQIQWLDRARATLPPG